MQSCEMINRLVKKLTGKEIVFVAYHRNSIPLIEANRDKYIFFDPGFLWRLMGIVGRRSKLRYRLMYLVLSLIKPAWIIDFNWLDKLQSLYLVWANNHNKQFVVVQHGIYYGGIMRDIPEKYIKCNIMLVWSDYFRKMFLKNNPGKAFRCISFGNPVYNQFDRSLIEYPKNIGNRVLIAPSLLQGHRLERYYELIEILSNLGFDVTVKEHNKQGTESDTITGYKKIKGNSFRLYQQLKSQTFDFVITDVSSAMTDVIFFKNRVIYFSPKFEGEDFNENIYGEFLANLNDSLEDIKSRSDMLSFLNIEAQERLLKRLIKIEELSNDLFQLVENREKKASQKN